MAFWNQLQFIITLTFVWYIYILLELPYKVYFDMLKRVGGF